MFVPTTPLNMPSNPGFNFQQYGVRQYEAILLVFTPQAIPTQVARPYVYSFSNIFLNELISSRSAGEALAPTADISQSMGTAVLPAAEGILINTKPLSERWTFILIIDTKEGLGLTNRNIYSGFFIDEPVNRATMQMGNSPTINPNAIMQFATCMQVANSDLITTGMPDSRLYVHKLADVISPIANQLSGRELFLMTPAKLSTSAQQTAPDEMMILFNEVGLANMTANQPNVACRLKSPRHLLRDIANSVDAAAACAKTSFVQNDVDQAQGTGHIPGFDNSPGTFQYALAQNLCSSECTTHITGPINTMRQLTLAALDHMFPNMLVQVTQIPQNYLGMHRPQEINNAQNVLSTMISHTIGTLASSFAISDIAFRYSSRSFDILNPNQGMWEIHRVNMIQSGVSDADIHNTVNRFLMVLSNDLWPLIKLTHGDFQIMVSHTQCGATYIDLQLLDFGKVDGIYVAESKLAGITNPLIGNDQHLDNNVNQLRMLADSFAANFNSPAMVLPPALLGMSALSVPPVAHISSPHANMVQGSIA